MVRCVARVGGSGELVRLAYSSAGGDGHAQTLINHRYGLNGRLMTLTNFHS